MMTDIRTMPQAEAIAHLTRILPARVDVSMALVQQAEGSAIEVLTIAPGAGLPYPAIVYPTGGGDLGEGTFAPASGFTTPATPEFDPLYAGGVYGQYWADYDLSGNLVRVRFQQSERHGGFLAENLEWIGPLAVGAFAAFAPGLLAPYQAADAVASTATTGGSDVLDDVIDWADDYGEWSMPEFTTPDLAPPLSPSDLAAPITESVPSWTPTAPSAPPVASSPGWTLPGGDIFSGLPDLVKGATAAARQALQLVSTVRAVQQVIEGPQAGQGARIARPDGTILVTGPDGRARIERPPPGVAQVMPDGGFLVNNGDGTYTRVYSDGRRQVLRYGAPSGPYGAAGPSMGAAGLLSSPWVLVGGAAIAGLLLARTFRR